MKKSIFILAALFCALFCNAAVKEPDTYNYRRGVETIREGDTEKGIDLLNRELQEHPKNGYAYLWIGAGRGRLGEYGKAMTAINYALKYLPMKDKNNVAWAYKLRALTYLNLEDTVAALADYSQAIKTAPDVLDYYEERANIYFEQKQYDMGNADYLQMIKIEPGNTDGYMGYGRNLRDQGKLDEAIEQFSYAFKLDKAYSQALAFRAECYTKQKKYEEAIADIIKAIEMDENRKAIYLLVYIEKEGVEYATPQLKIQMAKNPNTPLWYVLTGMLYEQQKMYRKAIAMYEKTKTLDADMWYDSEIADCYKSMGDYTNALRYQHIIFDADSTDANAMMHIADIYNEMDSVDLALEWAGKAIALHPDFANWYYRRGWYADKAGRWDEAIEDYNMAITINMQYAYALLCRGQLYHFQGNEELARKDFEKVIAVEPWPGDEENPCAQYAYFYLGDTAKAIAFMDSVLVKYPDNFYDAACLYSLMGDTTTSLSYLRKSFENGYRRFAHLRKDDDMSNVRSTNGYQALFEEFLQKYQEELKQDSETIDELKEVTYEVPFTASNGVTKVDCTINGLPLNFIFDTGASDVTISQTEANFMFKNGYLAQKDIVGKQRYQTADGNISVGTVFILNKINFGGLELNSVRASVVANQKAPLLLGQTVLQRLGKIEIDNAKKVLKITTKK